MTRRGFRRPLLDDDVVVHSTSELEREGISSLVKKPFRCLVGGRSENHHDEFAVMPPDDDDTAHFDDYGFEATLQESKNKKKSRSFRKHKGDYSSSASLEEAPPPSSESAAVLNNRSLLDPYALSGKSANSFESIPPDQLDAIMNGRNRSFADAIPPGKKNDPLDSDSIRDVSKALREMERKLEAAGNEGKKVSRTKVMKALLTVVDQLDDEQHTSFMGASPAIIYNNDANAELYRTWTGNRDSSTTTDANHADAVALDRQRRNLEQMRELTITPNKERAESPWKGDKPSFGQLDGHQLFTESKSTEDTEPEPEYISSSSEEERTRFSEETEESRHINTTSKRNKRGNKKKGFFAKGVYDDDDEEEETSTVEEETGESKVPYYFPPPRGKSRKGTFAHAVSPSAARSVTRNSSFDMFNLDIKDPAVHDALADLLWIPSPNKSMDASTTSSTKPNVVSPYHPSDDQQLNAMRNNESMLSYNGEHEYYDKPDTVNEETQQKRPPRSSSWWKRRTRASLKPSSKDTPIVPLEKTKSHARNSLETRVTVTQQEDAADLDPWQEDDEEHEWEQD